MAQHRPRLLTLSAKEELILQLLVRQQEMYGLELVAASKRRLKRGTVYVTLGRMEEKGYTSHRGSRTLPQVPAGCLVGCINLRHWAAAC